MKKLIIDCLTGETKVKSLTQAELAARDAEISAHEAERVEREAQAQQRESDLAAIEARAESDPEFAALARVMGVNLP